MVSVDGGMVLSVLRFDTLPIASCHMRAQDTICCGRSSWLNSRLSLVVPVRKLCGQFKTTKICRRWRARTANNDFRGGFSYKNHHLFPSPVWFFRDDLQLIHVDPLRQLSIAGQVFVLQQVWKRLNLGMTGGWINLIKDPTRTRGLPLVRLGPILSVAGPVDPLRSLWNPLVLAWL